MRAKFRKTGEKFVQICTIHEFHEFDDSQRMTIAKTKL